MISFAILLTLSFVLRTVIGLRSVLKGLTARSAAGWAIAACIVAMASVSMRLLPDIPDGITSATHSLAAVLFLAPLIDILGARNPGHRAWPWFVVIPMVVVLQWSNVSHLFSERLVTPVRIPVPALSGFLLVLTMGTGNHFGTANTSACLFGAAAILLFTLPVTEWGVWPGDIVCLVSSICLAISAILVEGRHKAPGERIGHEQLWIDFRDIYGVVWSRRSMDRINQFANRENWNVRMTLNGFRPWSNSPQSMENTERPEEILRWVLRRFAEDDFLDAYLRGSQPRTGCRGP